MGIKENSKIQAQRLCDRGSGEQGAMGRSRWLHTMSCTWATSSGYVDSAVSEAESKLGDAGEERLDNVPSSGVREVTKQGCKAGLLGVRADKGQRLMHRDMGRHQAAEQGIQQVSEEPGASKAHQHSAQKAEPGLATHRDWLQIVGSWNHRKRLSLVGRSKGAT